jgi:hypothetical protein
MIDIRELVKISLENKPPELLYPTSEAEIVLVSKSRKINTRTLVDLLTKYAEMGARESQIELTIFSEPACNFEFQRTDTDTCTVRLAIE